MAKAVVLSLILVLACETAACLADTCQASAVVRGDEPEGEISRHIYGQ